MLASSEAADSVAGGEKRQKSGEGRREQDREESGELRVRLHVALKRRADSPGDKAPC